MKPTQIAELLANIKATFVSFFSILMFVALGVGIFLGISWTSPALQNAAETMFNEGSFHNFQIQFPYGVTDDDLKQISEIEGVTQVETAYQSFQTLRKSDSVYTVKVESLENEIDTPIIVEGELPTKPNEMAFHAESATSLGINVGDTVTFDKDGGGDDALDLSAISAEDSEKSKDAESADSATDAKDSASTNTSGMKYLTESSFKVTAIVNNPNYIAKSSSTYGYSTSASGAVNALAWVPDGAFAPSAFQNGYPIVNIRSDSLAGINTFSDEYSQKSGEIADRITDLGNTLAPIRYDTLHDNAQKKIEEGEQKLADANKKIADGEKQIKEGEAKLKEFQTLLKKETAAGEAKLAEAYDTLMAGEAAKAEGKAKLDAAEAKLSRAESAMATVDAMKAEVRAAVNDLKSYRAAQKKKLKAGKITREQYNSRLDNYGAQIRVEIGPVAEAADSSVPTIDHTNYDAAIKAINAILKNSDKMKVEIEGKTMTLGQARKKLAEFEKKAAAGRRTYNQKSAELADGWAKYYAGQETLETKKAEGEQKIAEGEAKLKEAKKEVKEGKAKVAEMEPKLEAAKDQFEALQKYDWTVMPRSYNGGVVEVNTLGGVTNNLSYSMAALFIIVGLLVSYFAISRIVHEQITQIGTKKALGLRQREITTSFLCYSAIAVVVGAIVGTILGVIAVEGINGSVLGGMFAFGSYPPYFGLPLFLIISGLELVLVLGATYLACRNILKQQAVELLKGTKPPTGKTRFYEKWGFWDKLPLFTQTVINNCVNDKRRVLSTIVGVAGSTALIVTAITMNNDVLKSYDYQYENVYGFDTISYVNSDPEDAPANLEAALQEKGASTTSVYLKRQLMELPDGETGPMRIIVPADEETFLQTYHINPLSGGTADLSGEGAYVSQAYANHYGAKVGDTVVIHGTDGATHEVPILGFYEFWLTYHEMVMGKGYYEKEFGTFTPSAVLANMGDASFDELESAASKVKGFSSISDDKTYQHGNFETFSKVSSAVVAIYLLLATLMAIVVLLNLDVMFIDEKKRELIVLMINGYSVKDAKRYIAYDSIALTVLGIICGLILGCIMGSITVSTIEPSTAAFVKDIDAMAVIVGIVGSIILAVIMGLIALRRIPRFNLTDINKV